MRISIGRQTARSAQLLRAPPPLAPSMDTHADSLSTIKALITDTDIRQGSPCQTKRLEIKEARIKKRNPSLQHDEAYAYTSTLRNFTRGHTIHRTEAHRVLHTKSSTSQYGAERVCAADELLYGSPPYPHQAILVNTSILLEESSVYEGASLCVCVCILCPLRPN